jgi:hypothetical protein
MVKKVEFPDGTLESCLRAQGITVTCCWQMKGPKHTDIAWLECLAVGKSIVIVETFKTGGWNALTPNDSTLITETVDDVKRRCGIEQKPTTTFVENVLHTLGELDEKEPGWDKNPE